MWILSRSTASKRVSGSVKGIDLCQSYSGREARSLDKNNQYGIREIQEKLLEILIYYKKFCESHNLRFVLAGGTCLGAAREHGMIPWDDDVDVFMLREDYEKLIPLWNQYADTEHYSCLRSNDQINIHHSVTEIRDNNTTFILKHNVDNDIHQGLMIDVIPLDDVANSRARRTAQVLSALVFDCYNFQRMPEHKGRLVTLATRVALNMVKSFDGRYRIWKRAERRIIAESRHRSGLVASFMEGPKIMRDRFPRKWVEDPVFLDFEGIKMPVLRGYKKWLAMSYGNYMKKPPEKERKLRHKIVFYDMNHSYQKYKGIYYCKKARQ